MLESSDLTFDASDSALLLRDGMERPFQPGHPMVEVLPFLVQLLAIGCQLLLILRIFGAGTLRSQNTTAGGVISGTLPQTLWLRRLSEKLIGHPLASALAQRLLDELAGPTAGRTGGSFGGDGGLALGGRCHRSRRPFAPPSSPSRGGEEDDAAGRRQPRPMMPARMAGPEHG